jgi:hypothetical protein
VSAQGHSRRFGLGPTTSDHPPQTDINRPARLVGFVPKPDLGPFSGVDEGLCRLKGYDLADPADQAFAFDYDGSGKMDHLVLYRPGTGTIWFLKNTRGTFSAVFPPSTGSPGNGIAGYDLADPADQAFAFDYDGSGKMDHLVLYRPGTGTFWILKRR